MIVSSPNKFAPAGGFSLTPAMLRGFYLIWRSELQRGQFAEIRNLDGNKNLTGAFAERAFGGARGVIGFEAGRDRSGWGAHLSDSEFGS